MLVEHIVLNNKLGLHVRAASKLVDLSNRFSSHIELILNDKQISAKSILNVMLLAAGKGCHLTIKVDGADEAEAMAALKTLFENNFGET